MGPDTYAEATTRLFDILLQEETPSAILDSLARIVGETLGVDRSLIYDVSFTRGEAECLTEWLNPARPEITSTKANYPLALFPGTAELAFRMQAPIESHASAPHAALVADGAAPLLHGAMSIASLLWYPFAFRQDGFYLLAFNHVSARHAWQDAEHAFMRSATRHVNMALLKIALIRERARAEEVLFEAQKLESLGLLAGGIAHDFNNLMVGVVASSELLTRRLPTDSPLLPLVGQILLSGRRASALANQLLAYAGKGLPDSATVDLAQVVDGTLQLVRSSIGDVAIVVTANPAPIECNVSQLEQVVMNLVVNAAEAMQGRSGKIRIRIAPREIEAGGGHEFDPRSPPAPGRYIVLEVADDGEGIDPARAKQIFDPFFSTKRAGRGLGLSAVLGIVKHHRGAIRVDSTVGVGTTFQVLWPAATALEVPAATLATSLRLGGNRGRVLCIDDDADVMHAISGALGDADFEVISAIGGALGITTFERDPDQFDCVLLDLTMPPPSGREVFVRLRARRPRLPIVLMSGFTTDAAVVDVLDRITRFVTKPFLTADLLGAVDGVIEARHE